MTRPRIDNRAITVLRSARHCQYWHYQLSSSEMHLHPNHVAALIVGSMFYEGTGSTKFIRVAQVLLLSFPLVAPRCALLFAIRIPSKAPLPAVINVTRDITRRMKRISHLYIYIYLFFVLQVFLLSFPSSHGREPLRESLFTREEEEEEEDWGNTYRYPFPFRRRPLRATLALRRKMNRATRMNERITRSAISTLADS